MSLSSCKFVTIVINLEIHLGLSVWMANFFSFYLRIYPNVEDYFPFWSILATCILPSVNTSRVLSSPPDPFFQSKPEIERNFVENSWYLSGVSCHSVIK